MRNNNQNEKKKMEFSKKLVIWALVMTTICLTVSYVLALMDHDPCTEITVCVASTCIAIAVAYEAKSFGEKNSRNKYGLSEYWEQAMENSSIVIGSDNNDSDCNDTDENGALG